jgi:hypothetical protein
VLPFWVEHDPRMRGDKPFAETGIHPDQAGGKLFGIMLCRILTASDAQEIPA